MSTPPVSRNQELELYVTSLAAGGKGIARLANYVIFLEGQVVPGQSVRARITRVKTNYAEGKAIQILTPSPTQVEPRCPYFGYCGGCQHQNIVYSQQTTFLEQQVYEQYQHLGALVPRTLRPIIPAEEIWRYRNKMEFACSNRPWYIKDLSPLTAEKFALGLRVPANFFSAIDIKDCIIAPEETAPLLDTIRQFAIAERLEPYDSKKHHGDLRHVVVRKSRATNQILLNLITTHEHPEVFQPLVSQLNSLVPNLWTVVNTITTNLSGLAKGEKLHLLHGPGYIEEHIDNLVFKISPHSFFQTNSLMAARLYSLVREFAQPLAGKVVWDLYCGTGSVALFLAREADQVVGIEIVPEAVEDARANALRNRLENATFVVGNLDDYFRKSETWQTLPRPDIIIVDPPRGGLHPKLIQQLLAIHPQCLIYVSCNPATQVRDLQLFTAENQYQIDIVQPIDLFPHTPHVEVVARLEAC